MTIAEFIRARLDEEEALANAAISDPRRFNPQTREWETIATADGVWTTERPPVVEGIGILIYDEGGHDDDQARHIARHDPAHVLRDIEAKRMLLDEWEQVVIDHYRVFYVEPPTPPWLKAFAAVYWDHPEYREHWPIRVKADQPDSDEEKA